LEALSLGPAVFHSGWLTSYKHAPTSITMPNLVILGQTAWT